MEAAAAVGAGRGGSLSVPPSQPQRKEWRAVSEHPFRNSENEETEHGKLGQSDERTIYEEGTGPLDVDVCSITVDGGGLGNDILQQRLHDISVQRQELQQVEIELRAQVIARSEVVKMQNNFDAQIKEHVTAASKLKEQVHEREQRIHELEMKLEEKEGELRAVKIDSEAAWAKEDLLREQNKELATFRRERENSEAERVQHLKQIHELQEHIQEKVNQFLELEEQHRVARETILYKDEQLREAQAWVTRAQEMDTFHSTTNQTLQAELRERSEQFNQYVLGLQQQFAEVDRHHRQAIQQLQLELAEAREQNGMHTGDSQMAHTGLRDSSSYVQNKGNHFTNDGTATIDSSVFVTKGANSESFLSASRSPSKAEHVHGVAVVPSSVLGLGGFLPSGQVIAPHPFVLHPQGTQQSVAQSNPHGSQSQLGYFHPIAPVASHQQWQNQQAVLDTHQIPNQDQHQPSQAETNLLKPDAHYNYESAVARHVNSDYLGSLKSSSLGSDAVTNGSDGKADVLNAKELEPNGNLYSSPKPQGTGHENSHFQTVLGSDLLDNGEPKINGETSAANQLQGNGLASKQTWSASNMTMSTVDHSVNSVNVPESSDNGITINELPVSAVKTACSLTFGKVLEPTLLDEKSLLACIVRAIPAGSSGGIRISSTLPNRLGKMLAPLHWHDYKKQYGKLDDFVACHPELFVIEGDFIRLREGAQEIISATTAVAKVAAAAAASMSYTSMLPSVAVTPVAQTHRPRKAPSAELKTGSPRNASSAELKNGSILPSQTSGQVHSLDSSNKFAQTSPSHIEQPNGAIHGLPDLKISKSRIPLGGLSSETQPAQQTVHAVAGNGSNIDRIALSSQNRGSSNGRHGFAGKQQGR